MGNKTGNYGTTNYHQYSMNHEMKNHNNSISHSWAKNGVQLGEVINQTQPICYICQAQFLSINYTCYSSISL